MDYQKLFLQRWKELENEIELEKEDGETSFLEKDIFFKFFTSPELLVGYYVWRESGNLGYACCLWTNMMTGLMTAKILRLKQKLFSKSI